MLRSSSDVADSEVTLNVDNNWTNTWNDMPLKSGGKDITYTVEETSNVPGYKAEVTGDVKTGFTVTNSHKPETIDIEGTKTWDDNNNQDGKRPREITVRLLANGTETATKTVTSTKANKNIYVETGAKVKNQGAEATYYMVVPSSTARTSNRVLANGVYTNSRGLDFSCTKGKTYGLWHQRYDMTLATTIVEGKTLLFLK